MSSSAYSVKRTESVEDYLEAILVLSTQLKQVRSIDVATYLGFSKPSVSHAVKLLLSEGLIQKVSNKYLVLTETGKKIANETYKRHKFFQSMLEDLGVRREIAEEDACRIEHIISDETFQALVSFYQKHRSS